MAIITPERLVKLRQEAAKVSPVNYTKAKYDEMLQNAVNSIFVASSQTPLEQGMTTVSGYQPTPELLKIIFKQAVKEVGAAL